MWLRDVDLASVPALQLASLPAWVMWRHGECLHHYIWTCSASSAVSGRSELLSLNNERLGPWRLGWRGGTWVTIKRWHSTSLICELPCTMAAATRNAGWLVLERREFTVHCLLKCEYGKDNEFESQMGHSWCNLHNRVQGGNNCWLSSCLDEFYISGNFHDTKKTKQQKSSL